MNKLNRYENYAENKEYKNKLAKQISLQNFDYVITFSCDNEEYTYVNDAGKTVAGYVQFEDLRSLINECFKRLNYKLLGRRAAIRSPENWIPFFAIAETLSANGRRVQLHCHVFVKSDEALNQYLIAPPLRSMKEIEHIWFNLVRNTHGISPRLDITKIDSQLGAAGYFTKNLWYEAAQSMTFSHNDFIGRRRLYDDLVSH